MARVLPVVGAAAEVVRLGERTPVTIVAVTGPRVSVEDAEGERSDFELHSGTGHFVAAGGPYWGPRLVL